MIDPITYVQLTDLHISHPDNGDTDRATDRLRVLNTAIDRLAALSPKPAFAIVSGDLTNRGDAASYRLVGDALARLDMPLVYALGNHDDTDAFAATLAGPAGGQAAQAAYDIVISGVHLLVLDTHVPGHVSGRLDATQFAFLEAALDRHPEWPKLIVMHHPPALDPEAGTAWDSLDRDSTARLAELVSGRKIAAIHCGHIHRNQVTHWHGVPVVIPTGLHSTMDPLVTDGLRVLAGAGLALCTLRPSGLTAIMVALPVETELRELNRLSAEQVARFD